MKAPRLALWGSLLLLASAGSTAPAAAGDDAPTFDLPEVERFELANGLDVLLVEAHENPILDVRFVARAGSALDPEGAEGLASLTARMLTNGTPERSEQDVARELEAIGAELSGSASRERFELSGSVVTLHGKRVDRFLELFRTTLRRATFPEDSLAKTRKLHRSAIRQKLDDPSALADGALRAAIYGDGPRGRMVSGYLDTIPELDREQLVAFRDRVVVPQHGILGVAGDFDPERMKRWIRRHLGDRDWGEDVCEPAEVAGHCTELCADGDCLDNPMVAPDYTDSPRTPEDPSGERPVLLVHPTESSLSQHQWRLGRDAPVTAKAPDWAAFRLGTQILGGDFTARLNQVLRVEEGLTYGARFQVEYGARDSGPMYVSTFADPGNVKGAVARAVEVLGGVAEEPPSESTVASFRDKIVNGFPFRFETSSQTLDQYLQLAAWSLPMQWLRDYPKKLSQPSPKEVHEALQQLEPGRMVLVAVGGPELAKRLDAFGRVQLVEARDLLRSGLDEAEPLDAPSDGGGAE